MIRGPFDALIPLPIVFSDPLHCKKTKLLGKITFTSK